MDIKSIDHIVLTVKDIEATCDFYSRIMGMQVVTFRGNRKALKFGNQKINLHQIGKEFEPKAHYPTSGSADLCFVADTNINGIIEELQSNSIQIIKGPVEQIGAKGKMISVYFRDPDLNLVEVSNYIE